MSNEQKTYPVWYWCNELGVTIVDPNGFRDLPHPWLDVHMTKAEFERRAVVSTCSFHAPPISPVDLVDAATRKRGFEAVKGYEAVSYIEDGHANEVRLPKRSTKSAAGYDFEASETVTIEPIWLGLLNWFRGFGEGRTKVGELFLKPTLVETGVKAYMPEDEALLLFNRSSNPIKRFLLLGNGVGLVDSDYFGNSDNDGHIMFQFLNFGLFPVTIKKGERIGQGVFTKYLKTDDDRAEGIRKGGHGSTDKEAK